MLFVAKDRIRSVRFKGGRKLCYCDVFHYPHAPNTGDCNPAKREAKQKAWDERWVES